MNRRYFLKSASALALVVGSPSFARVLRGGSGQITGFNGGKTEIQSTVPNISGDFPFINLLKVGDIWRGSGVDNAGAAIDPSWLDTNGYPLASALARDASGVSMQGLSLPTQSSREANASNPMVLTWVGNAVVAPGNAPITGGLNGTSTTPVLNGYGFTDGLYHGRYEWYPTIYDDKGIPGTFSFLLSINSIATGSYVDDIQLFFSDDEASLLSGKIFGTKYKQILQQANPGVFRFMDWLLTNISTTTTWASRKPLNYPAWSADEFRASLYPGDIMTNSGSAYSLTTGSFTLADRLTMHVHFNVDGAFSVNTQSGFSITGSPQNFTTSLTPALTIGWTAHGLVSGQIVGAIFSGNPPTGMQTGVNYYVKVIDADNFQLSLTSGGAAIAPASISGGSLGIVTMSTLSLNGSPGYPIRNAGGNPLLEAPAAAVGSANIYGTVVFDSVLQCWLMTGATKNTFSSGLQNGIPIEVCLQLCKEIGMHPFFSIPYLAIDKMTDYVPSLAAYLKANAPSWMIPRFEGGNENWNSLTPCASYVTNKSWNYWGLGIDQRYPDWTGMVTSTIGQAVAAVYGHANLGTTYEILAGVQTDGMKYPITNPSLNDPIFTSAQYIANGPVQAGYTQTAASGWASAVLPSTYISPGMRGTYLEWETAWDWYFTSAANPTQQAADLNAYVNTLIGVNTGYTIPYNSDRWHGTKDWASRFGVNKMFAYEGGYSPDLMPSYYDFSSPLLSVFQANPANPVPTNATTCVITIANPANREGFPQETGNPAVTGMLVHLAAVGGMTQLNCQNGFPVFNATADVTWNGHNLNPNQVVIFGGNNLPSNIVAGQRYFVIPTNLTTNTFRFSATRGGSAITPNASASSGVSVFSAFVVVSVSGNATTIDVDTSTFPVATSSPYVNFPNSQTIINNFRVATLLFATDLQARMTDSYNEFVAQGGSFPSQFEIAGSGAIWPPIQPDIYGTQSGEFAAIVAFNH